MAGGMTSNARTTDCTSPAAYSLTARVLHWITAALVLTMLPLGVVIANKWGGPWQIPSITCTAPSEPWSCWSSSYGSAIA